MSKLEKLFNDFQIKHFTVDEILTASETRDYLETEIPDNIITNIIPTIRVLDELREWYDRPIYLNCTYRDSAHNKKVKGEKNSLHLFFNAIDFRVNDTTKLKDIYNHLVYWDSIRHFNFLPKTGSMGIGLYDSFIHIDTRAILGRQSPARW